MNKKDKILILGLVVVGGYFLFFNKSQSSATVITPLPDSVPDNSGNVYDPITGQLLHPDTYTPANPIPIVSMGIDRVNYISNLERYITDPAYVAIFNKMSDDEILSTWRYVGTYLAEKTPLVASTDPKLYNAIQAIHLKYGIF